MNICRAHPPIYFSIIKISFSPIITLSCVFLFEIFIWIIVGLFYLGGLIWAFKDWWDQDNLLYKKEDESWFSEEHDEHIGI